jgi:hypothetical protein
MNSTWQWNFRSGCKYFVEELRGNKENDEKI